MKKKSLSGPTYFRIPQSSILGHSLFIIYASPLPSCLKSNSIQYADDTSLYQANFIRNIQSTIKIFNTWSENNGLVFNNDKLLIIYI